MLPPRTKRQDKSRTIFHGIIISSIKMAASDIYQQEEGMS